MRRFYYCLAAAAVLFAAVLWPQPARSAEVLTLSQAIARAVRLAPTVAGAEAASDFSAARVQETRAPLFPSLSANIEYQQTPGYASVVTNRGLSVAQIMLDYTAFDWGRRIAELRAARYADQAAVLGMRGARGQIVFDTTVAYFDLLKARDTEGELRKSADRMTRYVAVIQALERSGRANMSDVLKIRSARDSAELGLSSARQARETSSVILGSLVGEYGTTDLGIAAVRTLAAEPNGDIAKSPALQAAERTVNSAELALRAAEAERYPTFKIALTTGFLGVDPAKTIANNGGASYDGMVSIPIFQGGAISARIDEARARVLSAKAQVRQVKLALSQSLAEASLAYRNARAQLAILSRSQSTADDGFALDWARFLGGGHVSLLEVLDAYRQAEDLRIARFDQKFAVWKAAAQARLVLGLDQ
jgi:outer membrane protein TolC